MAYSKDIQGAVARFTVEPEAVPLPYSLIGISVVPVVILAFVSITGAVVCAAVLAAVLWLRMKVFPSARHFRSASSFSVSPEGVTIDGKLIRRQDIHRAVIRNHVFDNDSGVITLQQGLGAMSVAANARAKSQLADVSYRVDIEAGGTPHTVASGLKEPAAFAVLSDVSAVLGLA